MNKELVRSYTLPKGHVLGFSKPVNNAHTDVYFNGVFLALIAENDIDKFCKTFESMLKIFTV